jgi:tetratricopeptide (TPR) repeat protein
VAEHWLYFSSAFLFAATALSLANTHAPRVLLVAVYACWLAFLGVRTWQRNFDWKDQRTFVESTIKAGGDTARMWVNLGQLDSDDAARTHDPARQQTAIADYQKALAKRPGLPFALLGLATAEMRARDYDSALKHLQQVEIIPFLRGEALKDRAALEYQQTGNVNLGLLYKATTLEPDNWDIQRAYITTLADSGKINEAAVALKAVVLKQPWRAESWKLIGDLFMRAGRADLAAMPYDRARMYDVHLKMTNVQ